MTEKPHILIVDDEPAIRLTLETGLSFKGFRVSSAAGGREAVSALKNGKFDAVICDLVMADGDGLAVIRGLREFDRTRLINIGIFLWSDKLLMSTNKIFS